MAFSVILNLYLIIFIKHRFSIGLHKYSIILCYAMHEKLLEVSHMLLVLNADVQTCFSFSAKDCAYTSGYYRNIYIFKGHLTP